MLKEVGFNVLIIYSIKNSFQILNRKEKIHRSNQLRSFTKIFLVID